MIHDSKKLTVAQVQREGRWHSVLLAAGPSKGGGGYRKHLRARGDGVYLVTDGGVLEYEGEDIRAAVREYNRL